MNPKKNLNRVENVNKTFPSKSYVMISYSWANKEDVNTLIETLGPYLNIWRDINSLAGTSDLWNSYVIFFVC